MPLDVAPRELGAQHVFAHERVVDDVIARSQELASPNGQQARIARARSDEVHNAAVLEAILESAKTGSRGEFGMSAQVRRWMALLGTAVAPSKSAAIPA